MDILTNLRTHPSVSELKDRADSLAAAVRVYTVHCNQARLQIRGESPISARMGATTKVRKILASVDLGKNELNELIAALIIARNEIDA